jgi:hypothetical protein
MFYSKRAPAFQASAWTSAGLKRAPSGQPCTKNNAPEVVDLQGIAGNHKFRSGFFDFDQTESNQTMLAVAVCIGSGLRTSTSHFIGLEVVGSKLSHVLQILQLVQQRIVDSISGVPRSHDCPL